MREITGDIWKFNEQGFYICITTNGVVKNNGELVMGAGIALDAANIFPALPRQLGKLVKKSGNVPIVFSDYKIITFPTKHHFKDKSDIGLIKESAEKIVSISNALGLEKIYTVRPGCNLGGLDWENQVKPVISQIFDWRFIVVEK